MDVNLFHETPAALCCNTPKSDGPCNYGFAVVLYVSQHAVLLPVSIGELPAFPILLFVSSSGYVAITRDFALTNCQS